MRTLCSAAPRSNEENAFWLLASLVDDILYPGTFSRNLEGAQVRATRWVGRGGVGIRGPAHWPGRAGPTRTQTHHDRRAATP